MAERETPRFDPYAVLKALDRHRVAYIVIGAFARAREQSLRDQCVEPRNGDRDGKRGAVEVFGQRGHGRKSNK